MASARPPKPAPMTIAFRFIGFASSGGRAHQCTHGVPYGHRGPPAQDADAIPKRRAARIEAADQGGAEPIETFEDAPALRGAGGAEQHAAEQPVIAPLPPMEGGPFPRRMRRSEEHTSELQPLMRISSAV